MVDIWSIYGFRKGVVNILEYWSTYGKQTILSEKALTIHELNIENLLDMDDIESHDVSNSTEKKFDFSKITVSFDALHVIAADSEVLQYIHTQ